jgi:membrane associated rhomboid family serine protease
VPLPTVSLRETLFPKRGISATELLLALNMIVAAVLFAAWGRDYYPTLRHDTVGWWHAVRAERAYGWFLPTIFLHAGPAHLASNMAALLAASGAVEFLAGGGWALAVYLVTGLVAAWVSYVGHGAPPLSVGSSGAVFGLLGCTVTFIVRRRRMFNYAKRWKVWRVYIPMFVLLFAPSIVNADVHAHTGGFACGMVLGLLLPPHPRIAILGAIDSLTEAETEGTV